MPTSHKPTTIADIARACGVSRWTVSAVLFPSEKNQHVGVGEATRTAVRATAERLRYRPHRASRNLLAHRNGAIGILTSRFFTIPWVSLDAMLRVAARHGQVISLESVIGDDLPLFIREKVVDGLITFETLSPRIEQAIAKHRIPAVEVNTSRRGRPNRINLDEAGAMEQAVAHLVAKGRERIALVLAEGEALYERERIVALERACAKAGLATPLLLSFAGVPTAPPEGQRWLEDFFARHRACDAVIAPHDAFVAMIYKMCQRHGRSIPADLAVVCMQNPERLLHQTPAVTAFDLPEAALGELAVETLQRLMAGETSVPERLLPYAFLTRGSTA